MCLWVPAVIFLVIGSISQYNMAAASEKAEAQSIVDKSKGAFTDLISDENFLWLHTYLKTANEEDERR